MGQIFDWDGTITGKPGSTIVRDQPFYTSSLCESRPNWGNMSICPHQYVAAEGTGTGYTEQGTLMPDPCKGQLILKCPFGVFKSPKKPTKFFPGFLP